MTRDRTTDVGSADALQLDLSASEVDDGPDQEDSAIALPVHAFSANIDPLEDSSTHVNVPQCAVAVLVDTNAQRRMVCDALAHHDVAIVGKDWMSEAVVIVAEARGDATAQVAALRRVARADAAIVLVGAASPFHVRDAHAAGAFACLRAPLVAQELASVVTIALDARASRTKVEDLARKLDLETHLASIGRFSAGLAHEISSPLATAVLSLEVVEQELGAAENPYVSEALSAVQVAHGRIRQILELMRELMQHERGAAPERVDVTDAAEKARRIAAAELAGVDVTVLGEPSVALANHDLLLQILQNLVANAAQAAKRLSSPRVRIHTYMAGDFAFVSVRDNGPGIEAALHERIFEPFYTTRRGTGGTGLGLALCREYALRMGAELSLWSVPGRGACFRVRMPRAR